MARLDDFLNDILKKSEDILIVAHAGSINGMISKLTKEPFDKLVKNYWEKITYGSLSLIISPAYKNPMYFPLCFFK